MRVNVYHEELTTESKIVWVEPKDGVRYCGLRIFLKSPPELHHRAGDDDRSAVTLWVGSLGEAKDLIDSLVTSISQEIEKPSAQ